MNTAYLFVEADAVPATIPSEPVVLANDGFCPDIVIGDFEAKYQLDQSYGADRRQTCLVQAMQDVNAEIDELVCEWIHAGYLNLASVPSAEINNESTKTASYRLAVYCRAMQLLAGRYRATDTKEYAVPKVAAQEEAADYWQGQYMTALHKLCGTTNMSLI